MKSRNRTNDFVGYILLLVIALSPLPLASNRPIYWTISGVIVFSAASIYLVSLAVGKNQFRIPSRKFAAVGLLAGIYLGYMALAPNGNTLAILRTLSYVTFFVLMVQACINRFRFRLFATSIFLVTIIYGAIGFAMLYGDLELPIEFGLSAYSGNAHGTFVNRNSYATYLGFGILLGLALLVNRVRDIGGGMQALSDEKVVFASIGIALLLVTLISTNSRMGVAAFGVAVTFFALLLMMKRFRAGLWVTLGSAVVALILAVTAFILYGETLLERLGSVERDADVRFALYDQVWDMILAKPWTGHGTDSFEVAFPEYHRLPVSPDLLWSKAHNTYLTNWAETGLFVGSIPILAGLIIFVTLLVSVYKRRQRYLFALVGASVIVQGAIHSTVDFSLEIQANMYLFLAIVALGYSEAIHDRNMGARDV